MSFPKMEFEEKLEFDNMIKEEDDSQSRMQEEDQKLNNNMMLIKLKMSKVDSLIRQYNDKMKENEVLTEQIASLKEEKKRFAEKYNVTQEKVTRLEMASADDKKSLQMYKKENKSQSVKLDENDKRMGQFQSRINELELQKATLEDKVKALEKDVKSAKPKAAVKKPCVKHQGCQTIDPPKQDVSIVIKNPDVRHISTNTESLTGDEQPFPFYCSKCKQNIEPAPVDQILQTMSACPPLISEHISPPVSPGKYIFSPIKFDPFSPMFPNGIGIHNLNARQHFSTRTDQSMNRIRHDDTDFCRPNMGRSLTHSLIQDHSSFMELDRLNRKMEKLEKLIRKKSKQQSCCHQNCCSSKNINLTLQIPNQGNTQSNKNLVKRRFANFKTSPKNRLEVNQSIPGKTVWQVENSTKTKKRKSNIPNGQVAVIKKRRLTPQQKIDLFESGEITPADDRCGNDSYSETLDLSRSPCSRENSQSPSAAPKEPSMDSTIQRNCSKQFATSKSLKISPRISNPESSALNSQRSSEESVPQRILPRNTGPDHRRQNEPIKSAMDCKSLAKRNVNVRLKPPYSNSEVHKERMSNRIPSLEMKEQDVSQKRVIARNVPRRAIPQSKQADLELEPQTSLPEASNSTEPSYKFDDVESISSPVLTTVEPSDDNSPDQNPHLPCELVPKDTSIIADNEENSSTVAIDSKPLQVESAPTNPVVVTSSPISEEKSAENPSLECPTSLLEANTEVPKIEDASSRKTPSRRGRGRSLRNTRQRETRSTSSTLRNVPEKKDENESDLSSSTPVALETDGPDEKPLSKDISPVRVLRNRGPKTTPTTNITPRNTRKNVRSDEDCSSQTELSPSTKKPRVYTRRNRGSSAIKSPEISAKTEPVIKKDEVIETPNPPREPSPDSTVLETDSSLPDQKLSLTDNLIQLDLTSEKSFPGIDPIPPDYVSMQSGDCTGANQASFLSNSSNASYEEVKEIDLEPESIEKISMFVENTSLKFRDSPESPPAIEPTADLPNSCPDANILDTNRGTKAGKKKKGSKKKFNRNQSKDLGSRSLDDETTIADEESAEPSQKVSKLIDDSNSCLSNSGVIIELNDFISSQDPFQKKKRRLNQTILKKIENDMHEEIFSITEAEQWTSEINQKVAAKLLDSQDMKIPAHYIVEHIAEKLTNDEDIDKTYTPPAPLMTRTEQQIVTLIVEVSKARPEFIDLVCTGIQFKLFRLAAAPQQETVVERLSRVFVVLSKIKKDREKVRMFICDAFYCLKMRAVNVLYVALQSWPEVLPKYNSSCKDIVLKTIIHTVMTITSKSPYHRLTSLRRLIFTWYGYPNDQQYDKNAFKQEILENLQENSPGVNTAVLLFCKKNNPKWSLENIIWPLKQMIVTKIHPDPYEAFCLLGNLLRSFPPKEYDSSIIEIIEQLCDILDAQVSADLQEGVVACLLSLAKYKFDRIARSVIKWDSKELRPVTKEKLKSFFRCHNAAWWSKFVLKNFPREEKSPEYARL